MRGLRRAADFLRTRRGQQERKCLDCGAWKVEKTGYTTQKNHGKVAYICRCKTCNAAHRKAAGLSSPRPLQDDPPPLPADPPPLTWETFLRGLL